MSDATSPTLLQKIRNNGDEVAWDRFYSIYNPLIESWLRRQGLSASTADDIRQEVMLVLMRELPRFEHNGNTGAFRKWLRLVTANRLRSFWNGVNTREAPNLDAIADQLEDSSSELAATWDQEHNRFVATRILELVGPRFESKSIEAFRQVVLEEKDAASVAKDLGMTLGAVRTVQSRVLKSLREIGGEFLD